MELCCPYCKKSSITKKGKRKEKQGSSQKYYLYIVQKNVCKKRMQKQNI